MSRLSQRWRSSIFWLCLNLCACTGETNAPGGADRDASADGSPGGRAGTGGMAGRGGGGSAGAPRDAGRDASAATGAWLSVRGNKIVHANGQPFRGRGANLADTRSCNACTSQPPNPTGLMAWSDELIDNWNANFVRF